MTYVASWLYFTAARVFATARSFKDCDAAAVDLAAVCVVYVVAAKDYVELEDAFSPALDCFSSCSFSAYASDS